MTGYHGFVQSIIRRGIDAYQITLGICPDASHGHRAKPAGKNGDNLLVYRADIAIEDDRTILFPDRELSVCMEAFYSPLPTDAASEAVEKQRTVGSIAARICSELSSLLLERTKVGAALTSDPGQLVVHN